MQYPSSVIGVIRDFGLSLDKKRGQCFLVENNILDQLPGLAGVRKDDLVVEIGAGAGNLTARLCDAAGFVVSYETDRNLFPVYEKYFRGANVEFLMEDFLGSDLRAVVGRIMAERPGLSRAIVAANIPYQITSAIIEKLLYREACVADIYLLMQKDVAERTRALPGSKDYGILSVACALRSEVAFVKNIGRNCFCPRPEVDSTFVRFEPRERPEAAGIEEFVIFALVKAAFNQRRKIARNAIANNAARIARVNGYPESFAGFLEGGGFAPALDAALSACGVPPAARAEDISATQYAACASALRSAWLNNC